jgi:hypothetical protein
MKTYQYNELGRTLIEGEIENVVMTFTENDIIRDYFPYWADCMEKVGKFDQISIKNCIEDWIMLNWAWEVKE